jgi:diguanylate cyclase (GGDEF)-like protein
MMVGTPLARPVLVCAARERSPLIPPTDGPGASPNGDGGGQDDETERSLAAQTLSDTDQTLADSDQTRSDEDQGLAERDQDSSDRDQRASDLDQAAADRDRASGGGGEAVHDGARADRHEATDERLATTTDRARTAADRHDAAHLRDVAAEARDREAAKRDREAEALEAAGAASSARQKAERRLAELRARAAADRKQAAADRAAAAADRAQAARDRERATVDLRHAHHDDLTGALRRELGVIALQHEVDRARRSDGRLTLAFIDVDELKSINDRDGHAAGDALLAGLVTTMRAKLRTFDPVVRYGGDEFICALTGVDAADVHERFVEIAAVLAREYRAAAISVGLAELRPEDTLTDLVARGDAALYEAKRRSR